MPVKLYSVKILRCLDGRYERYALSVGEQIKNAAIVAFNIEEKRNNEQRTSEFSPPKYLSQFRVKYYRETRNLRVSNDDPGWWLVEFGSHPGGNPRAYVRPYKPLRRGLLSVVVSRGA